MDAEGIVGVQGVDPIGGVEVADEPTKAKTARSEQLRYVQVVTGGIVEIDERVEGYQSALRDAIAEILLLEHANAQKRTNIVQQITRQVDALGVFLTSKDWDQNTEVAE